MNASLDLTSASVTQITYLEAIGDLAVDELAPDDVIDEVLLRAYHEFDGDVDELTMGRRLSALVREILEAAVKGSRAWRCRAPVGGERLDYWEADEDLKLEDLVPDLELPIPEDEAARQELRDCVSVALAGPRRVWRRALLLRQRDGLAGARLARALGKSTPEMYRILDHARHYVRQCLLESGCRFRRPAYLNLTTATRVPARWTRG